MPYMSVTLEVSKLSGWLNAPAKENIRYMAVTRVVSKLSGWLNDDAICRASGARHTGWQAGEGGRPRRKQRAGKGSTAD